jgi:hypothetical protein
MEQSESIVALAKALAAFQKNLKPIPKDSTVKVKMKDNKGTYSYNYADKATILNVILPLMTKEGLSLQQCMGMRGDKVGIYTQINHESGEWQREFSPINPNMEDVKDIGSWNTYISRYALSFVGVVTDDNDPDRQDITQAKEDAGKAKPKAKPKKAPPEETPDTEEPPPYGEETTPSTDWPMKDGKYVPRASNEGGISPGQVDRFWAIARTKYANDEEIRARLYHATGEKHVRGLTWKQYNEVCGEEREYRGKTYPQGWLFDMPDLKKPEEDVPF